MDSPHRHQQIHDSSDIPRHDHAARELDDALATLTSMTEKHDRKLIEELDRDFDAIFAPTIRKISNADQRRRTWIAFLEAAAIVAVVIIAGISAYRSDNLDRGLTADRHLQGAVASPTYQSSSSRSDSEAETGISSASGSDTESDEYMSYAIRNAKRETSVIRVLQKTKNTTQRRDHNATSRSAKAGKSPKRDNELRIQEETIERLNKISSELQNIKISGNIDTRCGISDIGTECSQTISDVNRQLNECLSNISSTLSNDSQ